VSQRETTLAELERRLGYEFKNKTLLDNALTHASIGDGARTTKGGRLHDNERLEFLGDRVLGLLTAEALLQRDPQAREGDLAIRLNALVNGETCAAVARDMALGEALRLSGGETRTGGREKLSILADACEAVMAAVYLDGGLEAARGLFGAFWAETFETLDLTRVKDPKTALQEWAQGQGKPLPTYRILGRDGPDHAPVFTMEVAVAGMKPSTGAGPSRQAAEKAAAQTMLDQTRLDREHVHD
jgi:ribonuclease-3